MSWKGVGWKPATLTVSCVILRCGSQSGGEQPLLYGDGNKDSGVTCSIGDQHVESVPLEASGLGQRFMQVFLVVAYQE